MRRKAFDALATIAGFVLAVVLLVAGGLLLWGHNFVSDQVHSQLTAQKIVFPPASSPHSPRHHHDRTPPPPGSTPPPPPPPRPRPRRPAGRGLRGNGGVRLRS